MYRTGGEIRLSLLISVFIVDFCNSVKYGVEQNCFLYTKRT